MSRLLYIQTTTGRKLLSPKEVTGVGVSKFQGSICVIWHGAAHKRDVHLTEEELRYVISISWKSSKCPLRARGAC